MRLVIVHYHLRPGGVRRVIEVATPEVVGKAPLPISGVVLATGEPADVEWHALFTRLVCPVPVQVSVVPEFRYLSEQGLKPAVIARRIRHGLEVLLEGDEIAVWMHNPGVGRNLVLAREVAAVCLKRGIPLVSHHHDWWFDQRWRRWPEIQSAGFRTLAAAANAVFPASGQPVHAAINQADAGLLERHLGDRAKWLPNPMALSDPPTEQRVCAARDWLGKQAGTEGAPVWLVPSRILRRKNLAEALLLTRWLRPGAWLMVTGGPSSPDEVSYFCSLQRAAERHGWGLRLGILASQGTEAPSVSELLAACEAVLFTSLQEGFGLPVLEAVAAGRPLIARRLANVMPDLTAFGFRFPNSYDEVIIAPGLFDWEAEHGRQELAYRRWRRQLPRSVRPAAALPSMLQAPLARPVPYSRLTLTAQLEVLEHPVEDSWVACLPWNPQLAGWRESAASNSLPVPPWPTKAASHLGEESYARRLHEAFAEAMRPPEPRANPADLQADFIRDCLTASHLYPLLWISE